MKREPGRGAGGQLSGAQAQATEAGHVAGSGTRHPIRPKPKPGHSPEQSQVQHGRSLGLSGAA